MAKSNFNHYNTIMLMTLPAQNHKDVKTLIKSLTKSQKKYIKLYSRIQTGEKCYLFIFDFYNKRIKNNDEDLKKALQKTQYLTEKIKDPDAFIRASKTYTYKYIMSVLRLMCKKQGTEEQRAKEYFTNAKIYLEKFGVDAACEELNKAHLLFKKYENYLCLIDVCRMELNLELSLGDKTSLEKCEVLNQKISSYSELLALDNFFNDLRVQFFIHYRNHSRGKFNQNKLQDLKKLLSQPAFNPENAAKSFKTHSAYYITLGYYSLIANELLDAQQYFKKILEIWQGDTHFITEQPNVYTALLSNYLNICTIAEHLDDKFLDYFNLLAFQKHQSCKDRLNQLQETLFLKLRYHIYLGQFDEAQNIIDEISLKLNTFIDILPASRKVAFFYNIIIFYFIMEKFQEASEWIIKWDKLEQKSEQRIDLQIRLKYFQLIIESELGDIDMFTRVGSVSNHIRHKGMLGKLELLIMRYLIKIAEASSKRTRNHEMKLLFGELEKHKMVIGEKNIGGLGIVEIQTWLESRMKNEKMYSIYQVNRQKKLQKSESYIQA
jgi:biopolymer transport protein ExbD